MKLPNGYGSVTKLSGKRRKPYMARVTIDMAYDEDREEYVQKRKILGYYERKADALDALAEYSQNPYGVLNSDMTVSELWHNIKDNVDASDDRKKVYDRVFDKYMSTIAKMKMKDVKTRHLQQIIDECGHGYSTKSNIRSVMKHIFRYATENDIVSKDYTNFLNFEQEATLLEREIYTDEEVQALWDKSDIEEYAITLVLLHQGMRIKELMELAPEDIDLEARTISIKKAKNKFSIRVIPIHDRVFDLVARFKDQPVTLTKSKYEYFTRKILEHRAYDVRHTFATKCNKLNIKKLTIQRIMGHKPDSILEHIYTHLTIEELSEAINQVNYDVQ